MENSMEIRLWRIFNLFNRRFLLFSGGIFAVWFLILWWSERDFPKVEAWIPWLVIIPLQLFFYSPKRLLVEKNSIQYQKWVSVTASGAFWRVRGVSVKATYTIWLVRKIEFYQNPVERLFGMGHIRVYGNTEVQAKRWGDYVKVPEPHVLYGIPHFDEFREQIKEYMDEKVEIVSAEK